LLDILNNCIPPTFIIGIKVIAIIIIPIPPNHWSSALHSKIDLGDTSKFLIMVEPVVVIPDMLSKNESVTLNSRLEKIKGKDPNRAMLNQDRPVSKKACCKVNFLLWSKFDKRNNTPKIIVIIEALINDESISSNTN